MRYSNDYQAVYRGVIVDATDPKHLGRVKLKVPQLFGDEVTDWAWPMGNTFSTSSNVPYGVFTRNTSQTVASSTTAYVVSFDTTEDTGGGIFLDSISSRIYVPKSGDYQILYSPQFSNSTSSSAQADVWLRINGQDVPRTNSRVTLQGNPNEIVITIPFIIDLNAGDYIEIAWRASATTVSLAAYTGLSNPTRPDIPSVIMSVNMLGTAKPQPGNSCWVMFEGGDPNFPLWLGAI